MKKPYIKKHSKIAEFTVWIVDGRYIRNNMDEEFTNFGQNYLFKFIPKNEFWIDQQRVPGEEKYYIASMLKINQLLAKGVSRNEAIRRADCIERKERAKDSIIRKKIEIEEEQKDLFEYIHKDLLQKYSTKKLKVWIVDGKAVRDIFFLDFTQGGHGYVYDFIPKNEIWIDDDVEPDELKFVLLHELHERNLMARGWCYDIDTEDNLKTGKIKKPAHQSASRIEYSCRKERKDVDKELKKEVKKNQDY